MKTKAAIFVSLFIISIATLVLALLGDNTAVFTIVTVVSHAALILFGYFYARSSEASIVEQIRRDILGD